MALVTQAVRVPTATSLARGTRSIRVGRAPEAGGGPASGLIPAPTSSDRPQQRTLPSSSRAQALSPPTLMLVTPERFGTRCGAVLIGKKPRARSSDSYPSLIWTLLPQHCTVLSSRSAQNDPKDALVKLPPSATTHGEASQITEPSGMSYSSSVAASDTSAPASASASLAASSLRPASSTVPRRTSWEAQ